MIAFFVYMQENDRLYGGHATLRLGLLSMERFKRETYAG